MNHLFGKHAPLKTVSKYKSKFKAKPLITAALQKSTSINQFSSQRCIKWKTPVKKEWGTPKI